MSTVADLASRFVDPKGVAWQKTPYPGIEFKPLLVDKSKGVRNVVVSIAGVPGAPKPPPTTARLDQKSCVFIPHVQALPDRQRLLCHHCAQRDAP